MSSSTMTPPGNKVTGDYIEEVMTTVRSKNPAEPEFHQAVQEVDHGQVEKPGGT